MVALPLMPGPELERYNKEAQRIHKAEIQPHCPFCATGFENDDSLELHMAECCPEILKVLQDAVCLCACVCEVWVGGCVSVCGCM